MEIHELIASNDISNVTKAVNEYQFNTVAKNKARKGERYYSGKHDILDASLYTVDENGKEIPADGLPVKLVNQFFTELVDQKAQYLLSNGIQFDTEDQALEELLEEYLDADFQLFINEMVEGASAKGGEYAYVRTLSDGSIKFERADFINTETIYNELGEEVAVVRQYERALTGAGVNDKINHIDVYTEDYVYYFISTRDTDGYVLDPSQPINPSLHVMLRNADGDNVATGRSYGRIPFYLLYNNRLQESDLVPVKRLIDNYDRHLTSTSVMIEDYDRPLWLIYGANAEDHSKFKSRIKLAGVASVKRSKGASGAEVDMKHFKVDITHRKEMLEIIKESIYKFGMGFDTTAKSGRDVTNVEIKSRYSLLDLKCNKIEPRLMDLLDWCLEVMLEDIALKRGVKYDKRDVTISIERNMLFNETDSKRQEQIAANTKAILVQAVINAGLKLDDETIVAELCEVLELNFDEVWERVQEADFESLAGTGGVIVESGAIESGDTEED